MRHGIQPFSQACLARLVTDPLITKGIPFNPFPGEMDAILVTRERNENRFMQRKTCTGTMCGV
jgi:hypothetical protein